MGNNIMYFRSKSRYNIFSGDIPFSISKISDLATIKIEMCTPNSMWNNSAKIFNLFNKSFHIEKRQLKRLSINKEYVYDLNSLTNWRHYDLFDINRRNI